MNANVSMVLVPMASFKNLKIKAAQQKMMIVPPYFNWIERNSQVTKPLYQGRCGSCWAFAIATCISDNYLIQNLVPKNPLLSITYLMSCIDTQNGASGHNGGVPIQVLSWIQQNGIKSSITKSHDYEWCFENEVCNGKTSSSSENLNRLLPTCATTPPKLSFFIDKVETPTLPTTNLDKTKLDEMTSLVKTHTS